eukprot:CAMPEP_0197491446 /NCGR_PEP_ID=MMETSP1311-20131121/5712_1 /TAXON_ID=464262 /ORGANISM="Genus nov. species nov., Strain RCC856" /LENGTH=69 /DNA_ID=CAMNT_0043036117 /DNA_START=60 /DNA_END=266 /DNA_ORIENTATION=+
MQRGEAAAGASSPGQPPARAEAEAAEATDRDLAAEEAVFETLLTRRKVLTFKVYLEVFTRTDEDIREAV